MLDLHDPISMVMSLVSCKYVMSNHLSPIRLPPTSISLHTRPFAPPHWGIYASPLYMSEPSLPHLPHLIYQEVTLTLFLILWLLVYPHIYINILIFATFIFWMCEFLIGQHSALYNIIDLTITLPLSLGNAN